MTRRKTTSEGEGVNLTAGEVETAAVRMLAAAQAHQRASVWCKDKPDAKPPSIDYFFFFVVSFELILLSVEQSLRLVLLLNYEIVQDHTNHNPFVLYKAIRKRSGGKEGIRHHIIDKMNSLGKTRDIACISEPELVACLKKHDSSYSVSRYFQLDRQARLNSQWEITPREYQVIHCLALALINLNMDEMERRGINAMLSLTRLPESEMSLQVRELRDRIVSQ